MTDKEIRKGRDADRVLNDPLFAEAFKSVETGIFDAMRRVPIGDRDTQHELVLSLQVLAKVRRYLTEAVETGKMADIQKSNTLKDKIRRIAG